MPSPSNAQTGGIFDPSRDVVVTGQVRSSANPAQGGLGYTGIGASVTQLTNRSTAVTINGLSGLITTINTSLAAEAAASFVVNNSAVEVGDVVVPCQRSGAVGVMTQVEVIAVAAGQFTIAVMNGNASGGTAETGAILINFVVLKGA